MSRTFHSPTNLFSKSRNPVSNPQSSYTMCYAIVGLMIPSPQDISLGVAAHYIFGFGSGLRSAVSTFLQGTDLGLMEGRQHCHYAPGCLDISSFLEMRRFLLTSFVRFCPPSLPSKRGNKNLSQKVLLYIQRDYCQYRLRINVLGHELSPFCLSMLEFPRLLLGWKFGLIGTIRGYSGSKKLRARQAWYNGEIIDMFS